MDITGARKIIVGAVILVVGVVISHFKNDIPPNLLQLLQVIFGGFIVGNVGEHVVGAVTARTDASVEVAKINQDAAEAAEPWDDEFALIQAQLEHVTKEMEVVQKNQMAQIELPDGDEKIEAKLAALEAQLQTILDQPKVDVVAAVGNIMKELQDIKLAGAASRNALAVVQNGLSTIITKAGLDQ